jgi:hypothetical protein
MPRLYWYTPASTLNICYTLAHEVGHHLIATRGYVFEKTESYSDDEIEEEFCNRYAFVVTKRMLKRYYYRFGDWLLRDLAGWHSRFWVYFMEAGKIRGSVSMFLYGLSPRPKSRGCPVLVSAC